MAAFNRNRNNRHSGPIPQKKATAAADSIFNCTRSLLRLNNFFTKYIALMKCQRQQANKNKNKGWQPSALWTRFAVAEQRQFGRDDVTNHKSKRTWLKQPAHSNVILLGPSLVCWLFICFGNLDLTTVHRTARMSLLAWNDFVEGVWGDFTWIRTL